MIDLDPIDLFFIGLIAIFGCIAVAIISCPTLGATVTEEQITIVGYVPDGDGRIYIISSDDRVFYATKPDSLRIASLPLPYSCTISIASYPVFENLGASPTASLLNSSAPVSGGDAP